MDIHDVKRLERVAEELMGRRKWKLYQDILTGKNINAETATATATNNIEEKLTPSKVTETEDETRIHSQYENKLPSNTNHIDGSESVTTVEGATLTDNTTDSTTITSKTADTPANLKLTENEVGKDTHLDNNRDEFAATEPKSDTDVQVPTLLNNNNINNATKSGSSSCENHQDLPTPIDWKPQDKCYFCVDGKLLTVNDKGELVAETGSTPNESDLISTIIPGSDEDTSDSSDTEVQRQVAGLRVNQNPAANLFPGGLPPNMTSFESMAMAVAQFQGLQQGLHGLPTGLAVLYPGLFYQQIANQMSSPVISLDNPPTTSPSSAQSATNVDPPTTGAGPSSEGGSTSGGGGTSGGTGEQPLDLSAKSSTSGTPVSDPKHIFKAKPRLTTVTGRRTYTEEELQNALQDILSGKLGTRRAAVLYGIPRSTLRNKVYKYAMEQKREALVNAPRIEVIDADDDDKDSGPEDDLHGPDVAMQNYMKMFENSASSKTANDMLKDAVKASTSAPSPRTPPPTNPFLQDPNILMQLQSLLLPGLLAQKPEEAAELLRKFVEQELIKKSMQASAVGSESSNNGPAATAAPNPEQRFMMQNMMYMQQQQQQQQQHQQQQQMHQNILHAKLLKSETPETASSGELNDSEDNMILKIPSYKGNIKGELPSPSLGAKNGENLITPPLSLVGRPGHSGSPQYHQPPNHLNVMSPSLMHSRSESQSPPATIGLSGKPMLSLSEVIAKSISKNFQQSPVDALKHGSPMDHHSMDHYKRPSISVIKNLGGTDISRFGSNPNIAQMNRNSTSPGLSGPGGKGTRPKRGKYRNYDRDSLVEAVKAVQRGEMSVHRAGSYYGVPHSTLEYKVKERHLMRPRKREPKPQPLDSPGGTSSSSAMGASASTSAANMRPIDKTKTLPSPPTSKLSLKTSPFPSSSPNGLKMFDPAMAAQLQYTSQMFWPPHPGFTGIPGMEYPRGGQNSSAPQFPPNADTFFASQMMQRFQDDATRTSQQNKSNGGQPKSARELAESLYDASNTNGSSFLDGIIRQTLDKKPGELPHSALFEQLVKNHRPGSQDADMRSLKRTGSPVAYGHNTIKREYPSPTSSTDNERDSTDRETSQLLKLREGLTMRMDGDADQRPDMNGTSSSLSDKMRSTTPMFHLKTEMHDEEDDDDQRMSSVHDESS